MLRSNTLLLMENTGISFYQREADVYLPSRRIKQCGTEI